MNVIKNSIISGVSAMLLASVSWSCAGQADAAKEEVKFVQVKGHDLVNFD